MINPERNDDTLRLSALIELAGKYCDSQVILHNRVTGRKQCIAAADFVDGMIQLSVRDEGPAASETFEPGAIVTHVTARGKTLTGTIRTDLDRVAATALDPYTFRKGSGWFIRTTAAPATGAAAEAARSLVQVLKAGANV